jgi:predicted ferric reductase
MEQVQPVISLGLAVGLLAAVFLGTLAAAWLVPMWLPGLVHSVLGPEPKAFWDLSRTSALTAYLLFSLSVILGLLITNRMARIWPGGPTALDLHQFTGLLGLGFSLFHGLILLGDSFMHFSPLQILIPFATLNYRPAWVGLGQLAFYLLIPITFSFYFRRHIGAKLWRALHYGTFVAYSLATVHGLLAGTDATTPLFLFVYAGTGALVCFLTLYRVFTMTPARA